VKKVLFIDRDGTLIQETEDEQIDAIEKLEFLEGVFRYLRKIASELDYELVMVTNQDGLGTSVFPENTFWPVHNLIMRTLETEGIDFADVHIDRTYPEQGAPTRKPGTGMLHRYFKGDYDLEHSFVIGDRLTDLELAKNIGCKGIFVRSRFSTETEISDEHTNHLALDAFSWQEIYEFLLHYDRKAKVERVTNETKICIALNLDGTGISSINTGLKFFDHMLEQLARHGNLGIDLHVQGDLEVDEHHTVEDTALALGSAIKNALGKKSGIERYGFNLPMDDVLAEVAIDFSGRPWLVWEVEFNREFIGDMPTEMFRHFFKSFSDAAGCNLNIKASGENEHHKIESIFKAWAKAIRMAVNRNTNDMSLPSTKGEL
jgi:imidazoleglycerol-phosphate dehydratase/histidinol-phosphatase